MNDPLSPAERSERMSRVRGKGNKSTEFPVIVALRAYGITGWRRHVQHLPGRPDFYFARVKLAVFVDGCFWHACPKCARRIPKTRAEFWEAKIDGNRRRDARVRKALRSRGVFTIRIWEHELRSDAWIGRLSRRIDRLEARGRLTIGGAFAGPSARMSKAGGKTRSVDQ